MTFTSKAGFYGRSLINMHVLSKTKLKYLPEYIALEVTNVCNFKCSFCRQSDPKHHERVPKSFLNQELCTLFLQKIRDAGIKTNLMHWTLDGEPFVNNNFAELARISTDYGFTVANFASNGSMCTIERLIEFPMDKVRLIISIDFCADKEYFEKARGTKGSWERIYSNIDSIIHDPRTQNVKLELNDIASFTEQDPEKRKHSFEALKRCFGQHPNINYRTKTFHNATGFLATNKTSSKYHLCPYPWTNFRIASNGDVVICCRDINHETVLGNLITQSVEEIWNGEVAINARYNLLRKLPNNVAACKGCDMPFDDTKFSIKNFYQSAKGRMQLFSK